MYREKVRLELDVLAGMLRGVRFDDTATVGMEVELNLVDAAGRPAMRNAELLERIDDPDYVTELGRFNIEVNAKPRHLQERGLSRFERSLRQSLNAVEERASAIDTHLLMVGILPTLNEEHLSFEALTNNPRDQLLNDQMLAARGEDFVIELEGAESMQAVADSIMPEAACTSFQLHVQVPPDDFADVWNASQAVAGVQLALGANSPFFMQKRIWAETRIPLFKQAIDTRAEELIAQGVRPRVWFGERWITSFFDLFEENVRYFPALLPILTDEDPSAVVAAGGTPQLAELTLHNGTVYRWNRPVYAVVDGQPHIRVENRVLPCGPTVIDMVANAAFYFGVVSELARQERPIWSQMSFSAAEENFLSAAERGIAADVYWPGMGDVPATELVVRRLLPLAAEGLATAGVDDDEIERYLGIIRSRCVTRRNGATWLTGRLSRLQEGGVSRQDALERLVLEYQTHMHTNTPVHEWPLD